MSSNVLRWSVLGLAIAIAACGSRTEPPRTRLVLMTGRDGGAYRWLGDALAPVFSSKIPGLIVSAEGTVGSLFNIEAIERGTADIAFAQADTAYVAYKQRAGSEHVRLRGMAVLYVNTVQIFVRHDSPIRRVSDLRGRRLAVGVPGSPTAIAARAILESSGLHMSDVDLHLLNDLSLNDVVSQLQNRTLDAGIFVASYPVLAITDRSRTVEMRLIPVQSDAINVIRGRYPFFKPVVIPKQTYANQHVEIETIGVDSLLICREDLAEDVVYQLTKAFFDALPTLREANAAAALIDPEQGPATSIPLHPGAARFYRERELR